MGLEQSAIDVLEKTRMAKGKNVPYINHPSPKAPAGLSIMKQFHP
ncbi:unnamed protein product, partial [Tilletia caries]